MNRRRMMMGLGGFPAEPEGYLLIGKHTSSGTFTAPEDGWFRIELQGASGAGGEAKSSGENGIPGGGGGGGGGCAVSNVMLKKGDTVVYTLGKANTVSSDSPAWNYAGDSAATIKSSLESYSALEVTGAANGDDTDGYQRGSGGAGGNAFGGNAGNYSGKKGADGGRAEFDWESTAIGGAGGAAGYSGGNPGGKGADNALGNSNTNRGYGKNAFISIYRGDKNLG